VRRWAGAQSRPRPSVRVVGVFLNVALQGVAVMAVPISMNRTTGAIFSKSSIVVRASLGAVDAQPLSRVGQAFQLCEHSLPEPIPL
jgi:hypothetical protein